MDTQSRGKSGSGPPRGSDASKVLFRGKPETSAECRARTPVSRHAACRDREAPLGCGKPAPFSPSGTEGDRPGRNDSHHERNAYPGCKGGRCDQRPESLGELGYEQATQEARCEKDAWRGTGRSPSESESRDESGGSPDDTIEDLSGNRYLKKEVLKIILSYKKNTRNFFWGDLQKSCNKMNRKFDDRWYAWTRDMMESIDQNEEKMRSIVLKHSHSKIQDVCREAGGSLWCLQTADKLNGLVSSIEHIERLVRSRKGMDTCWGRMKYDGVFRSKLANQQKHMKRTLKRKRTYDVVDYVRYKSRRWDDHYKKLAEKNDISKLYNKN